MHPNIYHQVIDQSEQLFGGAPGFTDEAVDVGAQHRKRVINGKQGVAIGFFEFTLAGNTSFLT